MLLHLIYMKATDICTVKSCGIQSNSDLNVNGSQAYENTLHRMSLVFHLFQIT